MNILVVDDTKNIRTLLKKCLETEGHAVVPADNGRTALELLQAQDFDLVFLDVKMPEFSGTEMLREARRRGIRTPVVMITAYATVRNAVECTNLGAVAYLQKPFTAEKVKAVLKEFQAGTPQSGQADGGGRDGGLSATDGRLPPVLSRARAEMEETRFAEAERTLKSALPEHSLAPELYRLLSEVCEKQGKTAESEKYRKISGALQ